MDIVKKNLVSIILGVVALVAVIASFYPLGGFMTDLQGDLTKREAQYKKANDLVHKHHTLPVPDASETQSQAKDIGVFPQKNITDAARSLMGGLVAESKGVFQAAVDLNTTECALRPKATNIQEKMLLVAKSLPDPAGSLNDEFKKALPVELDRMRLQILNGGFPASAEEFAQAQKDLHDSYTRKLIIGGDGKAINQAEIDAAEAKDQAALSDNLRNQVAKSHTMYVDPTAIVLPQDFMPTNSTPPTPEKMFYAQAQLWAEEDICHAISDVNSSASDVTTAPVKRLLHLDVAYGGGMYMRPLPPDTSGGAGIEMGVSRMSAAGGVGIPGDKLPPLPTEKQDYSQTPTGRTCNTLYDVVNISIDVHVDATKIPALLASLSRHRLVTVRNISTFSRIDNNDVLNANFVYGKEPVADLVIDIEQLQMREWTVQFMPPSVKAYVGATNWQSELSDKKSEVPTAAPTPVAPPPAGGHSRDMGGR